MLNIDIAQTISAYKMQKALIHSLPKVRLVPMH